jgi:hypothetical protein
MFISLTQTISALRALTMLIKIRKDYPMIEHRVNRCVLV